MDNSWSLTIQFQVLLVNLLTPLVSRCVKTDYVVSGTAVVMWDAQDTSIYIRGHLDLILPFSGAPSDSSWRAFLFLFL